MDGHLIGKVEKLDWTDFELKELMTLERTFVEPKTNMSVDLRKVPVATTHAFIFLSDLG